MSLPSLYQHASSFAWLSSSSHYHEYKNTLYYNKIQKQQKKDKQASYANQASIIFQKHSKNKYEDKQDDDSEFPVFGSSPIVAVGSGAVSKNDDEDNLTTNMALAFQALARVLRKNPETAGLRPWSWNACKEEEEESTSSMEEEEEVVTQAIISFAGLSSDLLQTAFAGKRIAMVGDSTLFYLTRWLQTLLLKAKPEELDALQTLDLKDGNHLINPTIPALAQLGWKDTAPAEVQRAVRIPKKNSHDNDTATITEIEDSYYNIIWDGYKGLGGKETLSRLDTIEARVRDMQPHVLVVNAGLHWMHLQGGGRDVTLDVVRLWLNYEDMFLERFYQVAVNNNNSHEDATRLLLFKTTNYICEAMYRGQYAETIARYKHERQYVLQQQQHPSDYTHTTTNATSAATAIIDATKTPMFYRCIDQLNRQVQIQYAEGIPPADLTLENITRFCLEGTFDETGVQHLNQRIRKFVESKQQEQEKLQQQELEEEEQFKAASTPTTTVAIFNDHDVFSCPYSKAEDGRHYHPLNLMRIRLLANMIQALYK